MSYDGPTNEDRGEWAAEAAAHFADLTMLQDEHASTIAVDLIADLLHWLDLCADAGTLDPDLPCDPESILRRALDHYTTERDEA